MLKGNLQDVVSCRLIQASTEQPPHTDLGIETSFIIADRIDFQAT